MFLSCQIHQLIVSSIAHFHGFSKFFLVKIDIPLEMLGSFV